jgi:hypothetical protein
MQITQSFAFFVVPIIVEREALLPDAVYDLLGKRVRKTESSVVTLHTIFLLRQADLRQACCSGG